MSAMGENDLLAEEFERHRARLRAVAYRVLGSISEADDAVQESWLRLSRSEPESIANLPGWLTAVVAVLDPDVTFRFDAGGHGPRAREPISGAEAVARQVLARGSRFARFARPAIVNGAAGLVIATGGKPRAVVGFTTSGGRIVAI